MPTRDRAQVVFSLNSAVRQFIAGCSFSSLAVANKLGLLSTDLQLLNFLELYGAATPGSLARYTGLSSGGATVALDRLERAGYIRRRANPADRRSWLVSIRPAQARRIAAKYASAQTRFHAALAQFTKPELKIILKFFSAANEPRLSAMQGRATMNSY
jgi:MarR family transcriptional regulator, organic hydroperoxide resistance regulator